MVRYIEGIEYRESKVYPDVLVGIDGSLRSIKSEAPLNQNNHLKGYKQFREKLVHQLVAMAYPEICGEWFPGAEVDHLNTVRDDNRAINLHFKTVTQNHLNPITRKRMSEAQKGKHISDTTKDKLREANRHRFHKVFMGGFRMYIPLQEFDNIVEAAKCAGCGESTIHGVIKRGTKSPNSRWWIETKKAEN